MSRTSAAIVAGAAAFALFVAGCGDDSSNSAAPTTTSTAPEVKVDATQAGVFVVNYRNAFPKLAEGLDDRAVSKVLTTTCGEIKAGKSQDEVVKSIVTVAKNGSAAPTNDEALAVYQVAKLMCPA
ncbi:hypothetical protein ACWEVD_09435 [Nocardia thailandica]|uniref:DUF732 domain-containing protein n=1 Tax=Nocardia thailandica TaxID=257275 RepID=A0ABW6PIC6_9NOCA|nr:hypothetical protein [Nocardia thailandica]